MNIKGIGGLNNLLLEQRVKKVIEESKKDKPIKSSKQGTARQTTLAFHYMQKALAFPRKTGVTKTDAEFVQFLSGGDLDFLRKLLKDPLKTKNEKTGKSTEYLISDLEIVRSQFEKIQFNRGIELIDDDLIILQNGLKTFNRE